MNHRGNSQSRVDPRAKNFPFASIRSNDVTEFYARRFQEEDFSFSLNASERQTRSLHSFVQMRRIERIFLVAREKTDFDGRNGESTAVTGNGAKRLAARPCWLARMGETEGERQRSRLLAKRKGDDERSGRRERRSIGYDKIVLVIGRVRRDPPGQRSRGKVLFNGIGRPSTMLIPLGTRSLLGRLGH